MTRRGGRGGARRPGGALPPSRAVKTPQGAAAARGWVVSVDPGASYLGAAIWFGGELLWAGELRLGSGWASAAALRRMAEELGIGSGAVWICETPQSYPGKGGREADLDAVRETLGHVRRGAVALGGVYREVLPTRWKGAVPKAVHHRRALAALTEAELERAAGLGHDGRDAVALGLWELGRTGRGGKAPGAE